MRGAVQIRKYQIIFAGGFHVHHHSAKRCIGHRDQQHAGQHKNRRTSARHIETLQSAEPMGSQWNVTRMIHVKANV